MQELHDVPLCTLDTAKRNILKAQKTQYDKRNYKPGMHKKQTEHRIVYMHARDKIFFVQELML